MITVLRPLTLVLATVLTLFVTQAIGEDVDFDAVFEVLKSDRGKLEEMGSVVSLMKMIHAAEACEKFRVAIDGFELHGGEAKREINSVFDSAFAAIDAAEGDHARKGANLALDLAKRLGANGNNPWYFKAGFRAIYANVCN
jgi:hypothetical protein